MGSHDTAIISEASCSASPCCNRWAGTPGATGARLKIMIKSAWGSDDPTKAAFPFLHGDALSEAGHEVQIFLLGEAVSLMRKSVANSVVPVGWPPLSEALSKIAGEENTDLRVWRALSRERCHGDRFNGVRPKIRQPKNFRLTCGVGGQDNYRIAVELFRLGSSKLRRISSSLRSSMRITLSRDLSPRSSTIAR